MKIALRNLIFIAILFLLAIFPATIEGQNPDILSNKGKLKKEIEEQGIEYELFKERLLFKGFDVDKIQSQQLPALQPIIEDLIEELILENKLLSKIEDLTLQSRLNLDSLPQGLLDSILNNLSTKEKNALRFNDTLVYGHHIFGAKIQNNKEDTTRNYIPSELAKIPDSYVLNSGDELTISIFGESQFDAKFIINEEGYIQAPKQPKIFLKGVALAKARELVRKRFSQFYLFRRDQFAMSIAKVRRISVTVFGEVNKQGSYILPATSTVVDALNIAGGLTENGTVREILLVNDTNKKVFDVYEFLNDPRHQLDFYLEDNALIQVPSIGKIIALKGAFKNPMRYEMKEQEGLLEAINYAGGLAADAYTQNIQIQRYGIAQEELIDLDLSTILKNRNRVEVHDGDRISIRSLPQEIKDIVLIEGAVDLPGTYTLKGTPKVSDLLKKGKLQPKAKLDIAFLIRKKEDGTNQLIQLNVEEILSDPTSSDNISLQAEDHLVISEADRFTDNFKIKVKGAVRDNIEYAIDKDSTVTLQQALLLAGGLTPEAADYGYIFRTDEENQKKREYIKINVADAMNNTQSAANLLLKPLDEIIVLTNADYTTTTEVEIDGAVRFPGKFLFDPSLSLQDLINLSGGLLPNAARNRVEVFRLMYQEDQPTRTTSILLALDENNQLIGTNSNFKLQPFDAIFIRAAPEFELTNTVTIEGEVQYPGEYAILKDNETITQLIKRAGGLTKESFTEGITVIQKDTTETTTLNRVTDATKTTYLLRNGDIITIPKKMDWVSIQLENTGLASLDEKLAPLLQVPYTASKKANWYIKKYAAGFIEKAVRENTIVQHPNGASEKAKKIGLFITYPKPRMGSTIIIPSQKEALISGEEKINAPQIYSKKGTIISIQTDKEASIEEEEPLKDKSEN